jgi:asparagine synthase (glutamine-hydrolysing)
MCGIAGIQVRDGHPLESAMAALAAALGHRGPDGEGRQISGNTALIHERLAIIDLAGGRQPLVEDGGAALIANAEIYNYRELREQMEATTSFRTRSDCEPPLHLYRKLGTAFVRHLRGMYAIAIHDPREGHLILARDPFGIKPLYYVEGEHGVAFASEPQALIAAGFASRAVAPRARSELLELQFTTGADTIFEGVRRVLPGEVIVVAKGRVVARERYPKVARQIGARTRRLRSSMRRCSTPSTCISVRMCPTACSSPAASIRQRYWLSWPASTIARCWRSRRASRRPTPETNGPPRAQWRVHWALGTRR